MLSTRSWDSTMTLWQAGLVVSSGGLHTDHAEGDFPIQASREDAPQAVEGVQHRQYGLMWSVYAQLVSVKQQSMLCSAVPKSIKATAAVFDKIRISAQDRHLLEPRNMGMKKVHCALLLKGECTAALCTCNAPSRGRALLEGSLQDPDVLNRKLSSWDSCLQLALARVGGKLVHSPDPHCQLSIGTLLILQPAQKTLHIFK